MVGATQAISVGGMRQRKDLWLSPITDSTQLISVNSLGFTAMPVFHHNVNVFISGDGASRVHAGAQHDSVKASVCGEDSCQDISCQTIP